MRQWSLQDNLSAAPASLAPCRGPTAGSGENELCPLTASRAQTLLLTDQHCTAVQTRLTQRAGSSSAARAMAAETLTARQAACSGAGGALGAAPGALGSPLTAPSKRLFQPCFLLLGPTYLLCPPNDLHRKTTPPESVQCFSRP